MSAIVGGRGDEAERTLDPGSRAAFAERAIAHRLGPILHHLLPPGSALREYFAQSARAALAAHLLRAHWVPLLLDAGRREGAEFIGMKGAGLAHIPAVYPEPWLRPMGDVDLLVRESQMPAAIRAAEAIGFRLVPDDPAVRAYMLSDFYHACLEHPQYGPLEIHHHLYRDVPPGAVDPMIARAEPGELYGAPARVLARRDLLLLLVIHLAITRGAPWWVWLLDIARLAETLPPAEWGPLAEETVAIGAQVFVVATLASMEVLWAMVPRTMPREFPASLQASLSDRERRAVRDFVARIPTGVIDGDRMSMARRLSGRPVRGERRAFTSLWCHPGAVVMELGVPSGSRLFWWHRLRHMAIRARRGLAASRPGGPGGSR